MTRKDSMYSDDFEELTENPVAKSETTVRVSRASGVKTTKPAENGGGSPTPRGADAIKAKDSKAADKAKLQRERTSSVASSL